MGLYYNSYSLSVFVSFINETGRIVHNLVDYYLKKFLYSYFELNLDYTILPIPKAEELHVHMLVAIKPIAE